MYTYIYIYIYIYIRCSCPDAEILGFDSVHTRDTGVLTCVCTRVQPHQDTATQTCKHLRIQLPDIQLYNISTTRMTQVTKPRIQTAKPTKHSL